METLSKEDWQEASASCLQTIDDTEEESCYQQTANRSATTDPFINDGQPIDIIDDDIPF